MEGGGGVALEGRSPQFHHNVNAVESRLVPFISLCYGVTYIRPHPIASPINGNVDYISLVVAEIICNRDSRLAF